MTKRRTILLALATAALLAACGQSATTPAAPAAPTELRVGFTVNETDADRITQLNAFQAYLSSKIGMPVRIFRASDYAGVQQAMEAGQLDMAAVGPSNYAALYLSMGDQVRPIVTPGDAIYYTALYVRADSPYHTLDDLRGKSLAFADINSASGYLIPSYYLRQQGHDPATFFGSTVFAGGHEQGVISVLHHQTDAGVTWFSNQGDPATGYSRGIFNRMVHSHTLNMRDIRILWHAGPIPPGPIVIRTSLPPDLIQKIIDAYKTMNTEQPDVFRTLVDGDSPGFVETNNAAYADIVAMRREEMAARRER